MNSNIVDVIIIGAGHAGLCLSYHLKQQKLSHLIFEKNKIGDSWNSQRWNSFRLNSPNKYNGLPGEENFFPDPNGFCSASEFVNFLKVYSKGNELPVVEQAEVVAVEKVDNSKFFSIFRLLSPISKR